MSIINRSNSSNFLRFLKPATGMDIATLQADGVPEFEGDSDTFSGMDRLLETGTDLRLTEDGNIRILE